MLLAVVGLVMMALSSSSSGGLMGILFGCASMLLFGCAFFCMKLAGARGGNIWGTVVFIWATYGLIGVIGTTTMCIKEDGNCFKGLTGFEPAWDHAWNHRLIAFGIGSSIANALALICTKLAFYSGPGGLVTAFVSSSSGVMFFFNFGFFRRESYPTVELVGLVLCLGGVILLGFLPQAPPSERVGCGVEEEFTSNLQDCAKFAEDSEKKLHDEPDVYYVRVT